MAGAKLEYCVKWQQMASAQESNNQMAIGGSRWPTEKVARRQSTDRAGQKKNCGAAKQNSGAAIRVSHLPLQNLQCGNQGIAPNGWRKA